MRIGFLALLLLIQVVTPSSPSNCWRGLRPLQSTCEDVKRILKVEKCAGPPFEYTLPDFRVMVEFENETCDSDPRAWRVPSGTVTAIILSPRKEMLPSEFGLDLSKYGRSDGSDIVGVVRYESREQGVTAILYRGFVQTLYLFPRASDEKVRCKPLKSPTGKVSFFTGAIV